MSEIDSILAGVIDADDTPPPVGFGEWIAQHRASKTREASNPEPDMVEEFDLNDLLEGGQL